MSAGLLFAALTAIVLLSKKFAIVVEAGREAVGVTAGGDGLIVAILILLPDPFRLPGGAARSVAEVAQYGAGLVSRHHRHDVFRRSPSCRWR